MPFRIGCESYPCQDLMAEAFDLARHNGAKIINMSMWGGSVLNPALEQAIQDAWSAGVLIVKSAGNSTKVIKSDMPDRPMPRKGAVLGVGSAKWDRTPSPFSIQGVVVDIWGPQVLKWGAASPDRTELVTRREGMTSMASAAVAGVASLVHERFPGMRSFATMQVLQGTAQEMDKEKDPMLEFTPSAGRVDAFEAVFNGSFEMYPYAFDFVTVPGEGLIRRRLALKKYFYWHKSGNVSIVSDFYGIKPFPLYGHSDKMACLIGPETACLSQEFEVTDLSFFQSLMPLANIYLEYEAAFVTADWPDPVGPSAELDIELLHPDGRQEEVDLIRATDLTYRAASVQFSPALGGDPICGASKWLRRGPLLIKFDHWDWKGTYRLRFRLISDPNAPPTAVLIDNVRFGGY
jgi:hypothetical protein